MGNDSNHLDILGLSSMAKQINYTQRRRTVLSLYMTKTN